MLTSEGIHGGVKHHLDELVDMIPEANTVKPMLRAIEHLAAYATTYRYPTATGRIKRGPSDRDMEDILSRVSDVLAEVARRFEVDLAARDEPARRAAPIR